MDDDELSALIRNQATRHTAGERLRAAVTTQIALRAAARTPGEGGQPAVGRWRPWLGPGVFAGFAAGVALTLALAWIVPRFAMPEPLQSELVADHVGALKTGSLIAIASADRHTVKPWFQGKLDYAPQVVDLAAEGFPLLGGRIDHVAGTPAAALTYARHLHMVSAFVWPSDRALAPQRSQRMGFNVLHWSDGSMQVWLVSDLEIAELERMGLAWRARVAAP